MALNLEDNQNPYFPALGLNATLSEIQEFINNNVTPKYKTSVDVTSAQLDDWGIDVNQNITLIAPITGKFINVTSLKIRESGYASEDFQNNFEGGTIGGQFALAYPGNFTYYQVLKGIDGGGANRPFAEILSNQILLSAMGIASDAGTLAYTFEIEYELFDI